MGDEGVRLQIDGVVSACSFFDSAADDYEGKDTAGLDNGIDAAFPGGASGTACAESADIARTGLAALSRRSRTLASAARSAAQSLQATDQDVADALTRSATWDGEGR